jgi:serine/threonine protein kinase, bacterial
LIMRGNTIHEKQLSDMKSSIKITIALASVLLTFGIMVSGGCDNDNAWQTADSSARETRLFLELTRPYIIFVTVSNLTGTGLVLQNNGGDNLSIPADGTYQFSKALHWGDLYYVTVSVQPAPQSCTVTNERGTVATSDINNITVTCL